MLFKKKHMHMVISMISQTCMLRVNHYDFVALRSKYPKYTLHPKYTLITLAPVSYLHSLVVRAVHRHRTGVGSIPAGGPYSL